MYITENSISSYETSTIEITNCRKVKFGPRSIAEMRNLRDLHLRNIKSLEFEKASLNWYGYRDKNQHYEESYDLSTPSLKIIIENTTINQIASYTFEGRINSIYFDDVIIENIDPFAFTSLIQTQNIIIKNTQIKNIRLQPFKNFSTKNLELIGVKTDIIPSRLFSKVTVYERFIIKNCSFDTVRPGAFIIYNPAVFEMTDTRINQLDGEGFRVTTRGNILFKNNIFNVINDNALIGLDVNKEEITSQMTLTFDTNTILSPLTRNSLNVLSDFQLKITNLNINQTCDCATIDNIVKNNEFISEIKCIFNNEFVTIRSYKSNMCSLIKSYSTTIIIVGVVLALSIIIVSVLTVYYKKVHRSNKYGSQTNAKKNNFSLIVPDGRTYRETELHVVIERADLLTTDL